MTPDLFGRSITSMIADGFDYEAAVLSAVVGRDDEMATDISRTKWMKSSGEALRDGLVRVMKEITSNPEYTKTQAIADLQSVGSASGANIVSEGSILTQMIDKIILEVTQGVADEDIPTFGSPPFDPAAVEEEAEGDDDAATAGGTGRRRGRGRGRGTGEAALDRPAATGRAGVVQARQQGRTERAAIRQQGRTERSGQRQGARDEKRDDRRAGAADRGDRRANRRAARTTRRAERKG